MKLRHKLLWVFGIPIALQIGAACYLALSLAHIEDVAMQEMNAKKVISLCLQIQGVLGQSVLRMSTEKFIGKNSYGSELLTDLIKQDFSTLHKLVRTDSKAGPIVERYEKDCYLLLDRWRELSDSIHLQKNKMYFSEFLGNDEFTESLAITFHRVQKDTMEMLAIYTPIAEEFQARQVKDRAGFRVAIGVSIFLLIVGVASGAIYLNRDTLSRLNVLMQNMKAFSKGKSPVKRLDGRDELAELDEAFAEIADERNRLEDIRKSMRAMVSHDLRSPLTAMTLRVGLLMEPMDETPLPPYLTKELKLLSSQMQRLNRLANTLLDIEKIEDGNLKIETSPTKCSDIATVALDAVEGQASSKRISLSSKVEDNLYCLAESDRITQVLVNLLSNAIKFSPKQSEIEVTVSAEEGNLIRFRVLDSGNGVPNDKVDQLFGKFIQLDQPNEVRKQGSGLGLYICKMLVAAHNGNIGYEPRPEGGSCFWFTLPAAEP